MLVEKSMHPEWLSNAFAVAVEGGPAVFVDSGADVAPLVEAVERWGTAPVAILRTHSHHDHVVNEEELAQRYSIPVLAEPGEWKWDGLQVQAFATPGHSDDGRVRVGGRDAPLLVWSPDYDGNGKAWVRFDDGDEAIVGGSRVERA